MRILAIDPALKMGWAALKTNCFGNEDFNIKKGESEGVKWLKFKIWLTTQVKNLNIDFIAVERVSGRNHNAVVSHSKFLAIIETFCVENGLEYKQYSAKEIKKAATGNGNASKDDMVAAAQRDHGYKGTNDNEADAIHLLQMALKEFKN